MEEDVNVKFDGYDEDLNDNPFFKYMQNKNKSLYDVVTANRGIVCIPRKGTLSRSNHTANDVENHLLHPHHLDDGAPSNDFKTLNGKTVKVNEGFIVTIEGFEDVKSVRILFEETFFNKNDESFQVLCLDQPLEGGIGVSAEPVIQTLDNLKTSIKFLWPSPGNKQGQKQIDEIIRLFNATYQQLQGESLRHLMDAAHAIYSRAMQGALKNSQLWHHRIVKKVVDPRDEVEWIPNLFDDEMVAAVRKLTQNDKAYLDNVKLAIETYVIHGLYTQLMKGISCIVGSEDAALNKINRNLAEIQVGDLGIKTEFCMNLPRGRRVLSLLNKFTSPLEKFHCLKKSITIITERKLKEKEPGTKDAITADDLLPALVFLVIKSDIPNWLANITLLHNFHFSKCGYNEFQFYLASLEAAVEHVRSGYVSSEFKGGAPFKRLQNVAGSSSLWHPVDHDSTTALDMLFEYTAQGNDEEVEKLLTNEEKENARLDQMCHPLCSCDNCEKLLSRRRNDASAVTVFSRDDMGRTVLHVAAEYGHANLTYTLIHKGAVVNAMDYHGSTPLHMTCLRGHSKIVLLLLHYKADANAPDNDGNTALHLSAANGHELCCKSLIYSDVHQNILKLNVANENGDTPLHLAARWGYVDLVNLLLERGASVEARNKNKQTPLDCATNQQVSDILLDVMTSNIERETGFLSLPEKTSSKSLQIPSKRQKRTSLAGSPAMSYLEKETPQEVDAFLRTIVDGDIELVRFKLNIDEEDEEDGGEEQCKSEEDLCHPLCQCEKCINWQKLTQRSLGRSVHVNCANEDGITPLHVAAVRGYIDITNLLLRNGANPNVKNNSKYQTPLHLACQYNHPEVAESLLKYQSKVNVKDYKGNTPLHFCCINGHLNPATVLLEHNANVDVQNGRGNTPLHEAARWNFVALVRILLEHGASVTTRNKMQLTPMQYAKHDDVVKVLDDSEKFEELPDSPRRNTWAGQVSSDPNAQLDVSLSSPVEVKCSFPKVIRKPQAMKIYYHVPTPDLVSPSNSPKVGVKQIRPRSLTENNVCDTSSVASQTKMSRIFEQLERGEVEKLQEIAKAVLAFDRRKSLKHTVTVDKSSPLFTLDVNEEALKEFDQTVLRNTPVLFDQRVVVPTNTPEASSDNTSPGPLLNRVRNVLQGNFPEPKPDGPLLARIRNILTEDPRVVPCNVMERYDSDDDDSDTSGSEHKSNSGDEDEHYRSVEAEEDVGESYGASCPNVESQVLVDKSDELVVNNLNVNESCRSHQNKSEAVNVLDLTYAGSESQIRHPEKPNGVTVDLCTDKESNTKNESDFQAYGTHLTCTDMETQLLHSEKPNRNDAVIVLSDRRAESELQSEKADLMTPVDNESTQEDIGEIDLANHKKELCTENISG